MKRLPLHAAACLLGAVLALRPAAAPACALELILAVDVSGSINAYEFRLQSEGLAEAFENASLAAAVGELEGGALVILTQWSGSTRQIAATGWHHVTDAASMAAFAAAVRRAGRAWRNFSTAIGEALLHAAEVSATAPLECRRRVIDVSGDGVSNEGRPPAEVSRALVARGFTINGLVIRGADPDPVEHYRREVIGGPGAFIEVARSFEDYPEAILRKLLREIEQPAIVAGLARALAAHDARCAVPGREACAPAPRLPAGDRREAGGSGSARP